MTQSVRHLPATDIGSADQFAREICEACRPVVLRGLAARWPAVRAATQSPRAFRDYAAGFDAGGRVEAFVADARLAGKYYYTDDLTGFNFERKMMRLSEALDLIIDNLDRLGAPTVYVGSVPIGDHLPGFAAANAVPFMAADVVPRIWIGHGSNVSCHYDVYDNLAVVVAGERRFTLYPPESIGDLYVGPIDNTMAGQPVSLAAAADEADLGKYPRFAEVRRDALVAELAPGDALYLPKLWWHQVEALSSFNCLVNYWWDALRIGADPPAASLLLAMLTIGERPAPERQAWKAFFDHYVFRTEGHPLAHLPPERRGVLGSLKANYGKLRAHVMQVLRAG